jgi:hypothetical protein
MFMYYENCHSVVTIPTKSMGTSLLLTFLFGPIGMIYSTISGALIMLVLLLLISIYAFGIWLLIIWPIQLIWAAIAVNSYNKRVMDKIIYYNRAALKRRAFNL